MSASLRAKTSGSTSVRGLPSLSLSDSKVTNTRWMRAMTS
jgi:hypothetical protein